MCRSAGKDQVPGVTSVGTTMRIDLKPTLWALAFTGVTLAATAADAAPWQGRSEGTLRSETSNAPQNPRPNFSSESYRQSSETYRQPSAPQPRSFDRPSSHQPNWQPQYTQPQNTQPRNVPQQPRNNWNSTPPQNTNSHRSHNNTSGPSSNSPWPSSNSHRRNASPWNNNWQRPPKNLRPGQRPNKGSIHWNHDRYRFNHHEYRSFNSWERNLWREGRWHHGRYHNRNGWWWITGGYWYFYDVPVYPYPSTVSSYYYDDYDTTEDGDYWYYCRDPQGYYPYVRYCNVEWEAVPARPYDDQYDDEGYTDDDQYGPNDGPYDNGPYDDDDQ